MMKRKLSHGHDDELRVEYDFSKLRGGVRGKYSKRYNAGTNLVPLATDVAAASPNAKVVNEALRMLMAVAKKTASESSP